MRNTGSFFVAKSINSGAIVFGTWRYQPDAKRFPRSWTRPLLAGVAGSITMASVAFATTTGRNDSANYAWIGSAPLPNSQARHGPERQASNLHWLTPSMPIRRNSGADTVISDIRALTSESCCMAAAFWRLYFVEISAKPKRGSHEVLTVGRRRSVIRSEREAGCGHGTRFRHTDPTLRKTPKSSQVRENQEI